MFIKLLNLFKKNKEEQGHSRFSDFFLHASNKEKEKVFKEAARRANEEQRELFERSRLKIKIS